jgi:hypothetical protein
MYYIFLRLKESKRNTIKINIIKSTANIGKHKIILFCGLKILFDSDRGKVFPHPSIKTNRA